MKLPQDKECDWCGRRIGDHKLEELWNCVAELSRFAKSIENAMEQFR